MVDCVITIGQDLITQTHVKFAAMQGVVTHRVRGRTVIGARVVFHTRNILHSPRTARLDVLHLNCNRRIVGDTVGGGLFLSMVE